MTDKVQKIREEVEMVVNRRLNLLNGDYFDLNKEADGFTNEIMDIFDSLQEEPVSEDLEEAANNALNNVLNTHEIVNVRSCLEMFRFGVNWKKEQLIKEAINGIARPDDGEVWCDLRPFNFKDGDKLKLIITKED
jgi:hypothetical protein